ncbi:hypothetical protein D9M70_578390 [compost metagenome]
MEIAALKTKLKERTKEVAALNEKFLPLMGDFQLAEALGVRVNRYEMQGKVDWEAVAHEMATEIPGDVRARHTTGGSSATRFTVNPNFDESKQPAVPEPRVRRQPAQVIQEDLEPSRYHGTFWF